MIDTSAEDLAVTVFAEGLVIDASLECSWQPRLYVVFVVNTPDFDEPVIPPAARWNVILRQLLWQEAQVAELIVGRFTQVESSCPGFCHVELPFSSIGPVLLT